MLTCTWDDNDHRIDTSFHKGIRRDCSLEKPMKSQWTPHHLTLSVLNLTWSLASLFVNTSSLASSLPNRKVTASWHGVPCFHFPPRKGFGTTVTVVRAVRALNDWCNWSTTIRTQIFLYSLINWPVVHALVIVPFMPVLAHLSHNELNEQHFLLVSLRVHVTCVVCIQRC